ncbi:MAG: DUF885 domain-containing protein [bacterium]|nr:DUF885 domain-containing protein [bacterium]
MRSTGRLVSSLLLLALFASACTGAGSVDPTTVVSEAPAAESSDVDVASSSTEPCLSSSIDRGDAVGETTPDPGSLGFDEFLEESYRVLLLRDPERLTSLGVSELFGLRNDQLNDYSEAFVGETQGIEVATLESLRTFDRAVLEPAQQISYDVYEWYLDQQIRGHRFVYHAWPVHHFVNSYNFNVLLFLEEEHRIDSLADAEDYICRLNQLGRQAGQVVERLRKSESLGVLPHRLVVDWTIDRLGQDLAGWIRKEVVQPDEISLYTTFEDRLDDVPDLSVEQRAALLADASAAVEGSFAPGWIDLRDYMVSIRRKAPEVAGVGELPGGAEFYEYLLRQHTSTDLTPGEIHEIGLQQVDRVESELRAVFDALGYRATRSLIDSRAGASIEAGFLNGTQPGGADEIVATQNRLIAEIEEVARPFFGIWPDADVDVVPDAGGGGFYVAASFDGSRPGLFHAGIGARVPLLTLPTINYHEAVPGHHTQIAIAQELDLPTFRRVIQYNAFAEGWALYAERLAGELGLYDDDPYGNIGRLELELLRAVRLVVDTGIHSLGWSREDAHSYMNRVIPTWTHEVERYMVLPGQATGYMIGQQRILELRQAAETELGGEFDLADFHDAVLGSGSLPMAVLERVVFDYIGR